MNLKDNIILAIDTSCDDTTAAVVKNGTIILSNVISSQISFHEKYGGVVPEIASRMHLELVGSVVDEALKTAKTELSNIDCIAVTQGPGLVGALLVGLLYGKSLALSMNIPIICVNHLKGHICANYLNNEEFKPPFVCLIVSGGHTILATVKDYNDIKVLGQTRDDAAGEAYDKVARSLGLGYPGGPKIDKIAKEGNPASIVFPRAMLENGSFDFSFSGLKSAVLNYLNKLKMADIEINTPDIAASFQQSVVSVLVEKTISAAKHENISKIALAGGVASNSALRHKMGEACRAENYHLNIPPPELCTDNAAMIGAAAYLDYITGNFSKFNANAEPNLML